MQIPRLEELKPEGTAPDVLGDWLCSAGRRDRPAKETVVMQQDDDIRGDT